MLNRVRYLYRRVLLLLLPMRAYLIESHLSSEEVLLRLKSIIYEDRLYFMKSPDTQKPFTGRFYPQRFTAIRNHPKPWKRRIKIRGYWHNSEDGKVMVRLMMSNPFSPFNFFFLGLMYTLFLLFWPEPFQNPWLNVILWLMPLLAMFLFTNISFQGIYKEEKRRFFKLLKGIRVPESKARKMGY